MNLQDALVTPVTVCPWFVVTDTKASVLRAGIGESSEPVSCWGGAVCGRGPARLRGRCARACSAGVLLAIPCGRWK